MQVRITSVLLLFAVACGAPPPDASRPTPSAARPKPPPVHRWQRNFGLPGQNDLGDVELLADGGVLVAGFVAPPDQDGIVAEVVGVAANGTPRWTRVFSDDDRYLWGFVRQVLPAPRQEFILVGSSVRRVTLDGRDVWRAADPPEAPPYSSFDYAATAADGSFLVARTDGTGETALPVRITVEKVTDDGRAAWLRTYGDERDELVPQLFATPDGGLMLVGNASGEGIRMLRIDADGDVRWNHAYPLADGRTSSLGAARLLPDGGMLAVGQAGSWDGSVPLALRVDAGGRALWTRTYDEVTHSRFGGVVATHDGGFLAWGEHEDPVNGHSDPMAVRIDGAGRPVRTWYLAETDFEHGTLGAAPTADGGMVLTTTRSLSFHFGAGQPQAVRLGSDGREKWRRTYVTPIDVDLVPPVACSNGSFLISGYTDPFAPEPPDAIAIRIDAAGREQWSGRYGGPLGDFVYRAIATRDDGFLLVGDSTTVPYSVESAFFLVKTDPHGKAGPAPG